MRLPGKRTLVSSAMRGKNIFFKLMETCVQNGIEKGMMFAWGSTTAAKPFRNSGFHYITGHRCYLGALVNPHSVGALLRSSKIRVMLNPKELLSVVKRKDYDWGIEYGKLLCVLPSLILLMGHKFCMPSIRNSEYEIVKDPKNYDDIRGLYEELRGRNPMIYLYQDEEFIKWIIYQRTDTFIRLFVYKNQKLLAYLYADLKDNTTAFIIDFASIDDSAFQFLLGELRSQLTTVGILFMVVVTNIKNPHQKHFSKMFLMNGFIPFYLGGQMVVRPFTKKYEDIIADISSWYLTDLWFLLHS